MQRYFINEDAFQGEFVYLEDEVAHHIGRVMRMQVGDEVICATGNRTVRCKITALLEKKVEAKVVALLEDHSELPHEVTIAQSMPKGDKLELVVQKGTELGASHFLPFYSERSIVKWTKEKAKRRVARLEKIAREAAEQAHRQRVPTIATPLSFEALLKVSENYQLKIVAYEEEARNNREDTLFRLFSSLAEKQSILFVVGPEGGFTLDEIEKLRRQGFRISGLGPRILRTETATMYFLAALSYESELKR